MTFYALAVSVSLAVWFLAMAGASLLELPFGRMLRSRIALASGRMERFPGATADMLFAIRALPLFLALVFTVGFALPAFLRLEPHGSDETVSVKLLMFGRKR